MCMHNFGRNLSNLVADDELFFFHVHHLKMKEIFADKWRHLARILLAVRSHVVISIFNGLPAADRQYLG